MKIHLAKPGGERTGPFTLKQINLDLAKNKIRETDFWAWYEGLDAWVPLYSVPGILGSSEAVGKDAVEADGEESMDDLSAASGASPQDTEIIVKESTATDNNEEASYTVSAVGSAMPLAAIDHMFVFTSGEGPEVMESPVTAAVLEKIMSADWITIRDTVSRDVFGRCNIGERLRADGKVPSSAWRAMSALKPEIVQKARDGGYRTCVRTFVSEGEKVVAVFLFYDKSRIK